MTDWKWRLKGVTSFLFGYSYRQIPRDIILGYAMDYNLFFRGDPMSEYRTGDGKRTVAELEQFRDELKRRIDYLSRYDGEHLSAFSELDFLWKSLQEVERELEQRKRIEKEG